MDRVPAGTSIVGEGETAIRLPGTELGNDTPEHLSTITRDYWLGRFEATAGCFMVCAAEGACLPPTEPFHREGAAEGGVPFDESWFLREDLVDYPMLPLSWSAARAYCEWLGGRLPTSDEWERAARGDDGRRRPWGDDVPVTDCSRAMWVGLDTECPENHDSMYVPVDTYPAGRGPFGHHHLDDNACEWTADYWGLHPVSDVVDYAGPPESEFHGTRVRRCYGDASRQAFEPDRIVDVREDFDGEIVRTPMSSGVRCVFDERPEPLFAQ